MLRGSSSSASSYYDIHAVLAEEEKSAVVFNTPVFELGFLDNGGGERDLEEGAKTELPIWLGLSLAQKDFARRSCRSCSRAVIS